METLFEATIVHHRSYIKDAMATVMSVAFLSNTLGKSLSRFYSIELMTMDYFEGQGLILKNYSSAERINRNAASRATLGESHATTGRFEIHSLCESYMT